MQCVNVIQIMNKLFNLTNRTPATHSITHMNLKFKLKSPQIDIIIYYKIQINILDDSFTPKGNESTCIL